MKEHMKETLKMVSSDVKKTTVLILFFLGLISLIHVNVRTFSMRNEGVLLITKKKCRPSGHYRRNKEGIALLIRYPIREYHGPSVVDINGGSITVIYSCSC